MSTQSRLILASASPIRKRILEAAGVPFDAAASGLDEKAALQQAGAGVETPLDKARLLARQKSLVASRQAPGRLVLGADQLLSHDGVLLHKPADMPAARQRLQRLRGQAHRLHSAAALHRDGELLWEHGESCLLVMRKFTDDFLDDYLAAGGKALLASVGAYRLEAEGISLFERIEGDYFAALGLPLLPLLAALRALGAAPK